MKQIKTYTIALCLLLCSFLAFAIDLSSPTFGYSIDLPEGFVLKDKEPDNTGYLFSSEVMSVDCALHIYDCPQHDSLPILQAALKKLDAKGDADYVPSRVEKSCSMSLFSMGNNSFSGAAASYLLQNDKCLVVVSYCNNTDFGISLSLIFSCLDSVYTSNEDYFEAGAITRMGYPRNNPISHTLTIKDKSITVPIDKEELVLENSVIDREFGLLEHYANRPDWKEAWQRCYRIIYRACYQGLAPIAQILRNEFYSKLEVNAPLAYAQILLDYVQESLYERSTITAATDFAAPIKIALHEGADCDSRSLFLCALLQASGIDAIMFISPKFSHAIVGIDLKADNKQSFNVEGKPYILAETTQKVPIGKIEDRINDESQWIPVFLN